MRAFSRVLDYHQHGKAANPSTTLRLVRVRPLSILYYGSQENAVPHATFVCRGWAVVHKPPGWEIDMHQSGVANDLRA